jgi:hypothetical protein
MLFIFIVYAGSIPATPSKKPNQMTKKEIVSYYGQKYDNVKHIKEFVNALCERYKKENQLCGKQKSLKHLKED